ncbi:MAG: flagellar export protein FliJ [Candidatus Zixiibacteriota bacterium]
MKKFRFRLQVLLDAKEHLEKERQREYAASIRQVQAQTAELKKLAGARAGTVTNQKQRLSGSISLAEMLVYSRYLLRLKRSALAGEELLKGLKKSEEEKRKALLAAARERQTYEKLKERQKEKHYAGINRLLRKEADETALNSHRRKQTKHKW